MSKKHDFDRGKFRSFYFFRIYTRVSEFVKEMLFQLSYAAAMLQHEFHAKLLSKVFLMFLSKLDLSSHFLACYATPLDQGAPTTRFGAMLSVLDRLWIRNFDRHFDSMFITQIT